MTTHNDNDHKLPVLNNGVNGRSIPYNYQLQNSYALLVLTILSVTLYCSILACFTFLITKYNIFLFSGRGNARCVGDASPPDQCLLHFKRRTAEKLQETMTNNCTRLNKYIYIAYIDKRKRSRSTGRKNQVCSGIRSVRRDIIYGSIVINNIRREIISYIVD